MNFRAWKTVDKIEVPRRQVNEAIRLVFDNRDTVAIHTLAAAGFQVLKDLCQRGGKGKLLASIQDLIKPGMEREFWRLHNRPANFFKHAKKDSDEPLEEFNEEMNDVLLFNCCGLYIDLGYLPSPEMRAFQIWYVALHPEILKEGQVKDKIQVTSQELRQMHRIEQLEQGKALLDHERNPGIDIRSLFFSDQRSPSP